MNEQYNNNDPSGSQFSQRPVYQGQSAPTPPPVQKKGTPTKTIVAFVLAIASVVLAISVIGSFFGVILAIPALILAVKERKAHPSSLATAAFVLSIVGLVLSLVCFLICLVYLCFAVMLHVDGYYDFFEYYDGGDYYEDIFDNYFDNYDDMEDLYHF